MFLSSMARRRTKVWTLSTMLDLSGSYKYESFELFGTIENLTNHQPPSIGGTLTNSYWQGQGNADYDRVGRQYRMGVRFKF